MVRLNDYKGETCEPCIDSQERTGMERDCGGCQLWIRFFRDEVDPPASIGRVWNLYCRLSGDLAKRLPSYGDAILRSAGVDFATEDGEDVLIVLEMFDTVFSERRAEESD